MTRWLTRFALVLAALLLALAAFFFWASAGTLRESDLAVTKTHPAPPAAPRDTLTAVTYNIGYLSGMTNNLPVKRSRALYEENMDAAAALLRRLDPDVIGFQEIDFRAARSFDVQQADTLAQRLGYAAAAEAVNWDERYVPFPYGLPSVNFGRIISGQAVLSRFPVTRHERVVLARPPLPFYRDALYLDRLAQVVRLDVPVVADSTTSLVVINVHLEAFDADTREREIRTVRRLYDAYAATGAPVLLLGDFNSVMPGTDLSALPAETEAEFTGDSTLALLTSPGNIASAFSDSAFARGAVPGTYPADAPTRTIDHIFFTPGRIQPLGAQIRCGPSEAPPADHCAVALRFVLQP